MNAEGSQGQPQVGGGQLEVWKLEIMKEAITDRCHVAVQVSSFDRAVAALEAQGVELEEAIVGPGFRVAYLKERDPAGNLVHVLVAG